MRPGPAPRAERQGRQDSNLQPLVLETSALPIELRPCAISDGCGGMVPPWRRTYTRRMQRRALGLLFAALAAGLGALAVYSALSGGRAWVLALTAAALAVWMGGLALRTVR